MCRPLPGHPLVCDRAQSINNDSHSKPLPLHSIGISLHSVLCTVPPPSRTRAKRWCRVLSTEERAQKRFRHRRLVSTGPKPPTAPGPARSASLPAMQPPPGGRRLPPGSGGPQESVARGTPAAGRLGSGRPAVPAGARRAPDVMKASLVHLTGANTAVAAPGSGDTVLVIA